MAVVIRLQRMGKAKQPHYRMVAVEKTRSVGGKPVEILGHYHPRAEKDKDTVTLKMERVEYWLKVGAKPSGTAASLIRKAKRAEK